MQPVCRGSAVPPVCPATSCGPSLNPSPAPKPNAFPLTLSDASHRAAYCWAVIGDVITSTPENIEVSGPDGRVFKFPHATPKEVIACQMAKEYGWKECGSLNGPDTPTAMAPTATHANLNQKRERYSRYLTDELTRLVVFGAEALPLLAQSELIKRNGRRDAGDSKSAFSTTQYAQCSTQCPPSPSQARCLVDCVDRYNATAAKVLGCQILPDGLPY